MTHTLDAIDSVTGRQLTVICPATDDTVGSIPVHSADDVELANDSPYGWSEPGLGARSGGAAGIRTYCQDEKHCRRPSSA